MRIAQVAPLFYPIPPVRTGGVERVISVLTEELVRRGHEVTLFASGDSSTQARLVPVIEQALWWPEEKDMEPVSRRFLLLEMLSEVYRRADEFDVIHSHADIYTLPFAPLTSRPTIVTLHNPLVAEFFPAIYDRLREVSLVSASFAQREPLAELDLNWAGTVSGGIPVADYEFRSEPGDYLAFLGRMVPEKRPDLAVEVARRAGLPLKVAASVVLKSDRDYWNDQIRPLFTRNSHVEFLGELSDAEKSELFGGAVATLFPSDWPEPFGLVVAESLACGTPVIALDRGAIREIIHDGIHGYICSDADSMVGAVSQIHSIDRTTCRQHATRYGPGPVASAYEDIYQKTITTSHHLD